MNLISLREYVANILDYSVSNSRYQTQVDAMLNDAMDRICTEKPWEFAQKEQKLIAYGDKVITNGVTASIGSRTIGSGAGLFVSVMDGQVIRIGKVDYVIGWVQSATTAYLTEEFQQASSSYDATVIYRYLDLPQDLVNIMQVFKRTEAISPEDPGVMQPLTRTQDETQNLPFGEKGMPRVWVPSDSAFTPAPRNASGVASAVALPGQGSRTVEVAMVNVWAGRESSLSAAVSITLGDAEALTLTPEALSTYQPFYRRYYIRCTALGLKAWRRAKTSAGVTDVTPTGGVTLTIPLSTTYLGSENYINDNPRYVDCGGYTPRIRLYPRQNTSSTYNLRYLKRAAKMVEDADISPIPSPHQIVIAYRALESAAVKHDQVSQSQLFAKRAATELIAMERRYLTQIPSRMVKGAWNDTGTTDRVRWSVYGTLTHT